MTYCASCGRKKATGDVLSHPGGGCYVDPPGGATPYLRCGHPPLWDVPAW